MYMNKYLRTHPLALLTILLGLVLACVPASAQSRSGGSRGQAVLHIQVNIVSAIYTAPPPIEPQKPLIGVVSYDFGKVRSKIDVTEQTHSLFAANAGKPERVEGDILKTVTVVPQ